jgi:mannosyltransferase OCH1-like enzyme
MWPRVKLVQFWDTPQAPFEVEILMQSWQQDPSFEYNRFSKETADVFIEAHFDASVLSAYRSCALPAMQADFFSYCFLYHHGGLYVDADFWNKSGVPAFLENSARGLILLQTGRNVLANNFLFFRKPRDPLLKTVIAKAVWNISARISNNVSDVTGPAILSGLYSSNQQTALFAGLDIVDSQKLIGHARQWDKMDDNSDAADRVVANRSGQSIFVDPAYLAYKRVGNNSRYAFGQGSQD